MKRKTVWLAVLAQIACCFFIATPSTPADTIHLRNGRTMQGVVLKQTEKGVLVRLKVATVVFDPKEIESIEKAEKEENRAKPQRMPNWETVIDAAARLYWIDDLKPIPATVIDKGILRHVPYKSHRAGDVEINIYGNPDQPAGVEIGLHGKLVASRVTKKLCVRYLVDIFAVVPDREILKNLDLDRDLRRFNGLTFEVTPETAEDAYGGWWVSVYDEKALNAARATDKELDAITQKRAPAGKGKTAEAEDELDWKPADMKYARPAVPLAPAVGKVPPPGGGRVYVRGYTRKDGTYVQPHTRSAPRRK